jgi:flagellar motor switch protein FliN/FliY
MGDGSLSQEEIDALLMGTGEQSRETPIEKIIPLDFPSKTSEIPKEKPMSSTGILDHIPIQLTVVLGETCIPLSDLEKIGDGSIVTLETLAGQDVQIRANGVPVALGEVITIDEKFGVRVTERITPERQKEIMANQPKFIDLKLK